MRKIIVTALLTASVLSVTACQNRAANETTAVETTNETTSEMTTEETSSAAAKTADLQDIYNEVKIAYGEEYFPVMMYDQESFTNIFGVSEDLYDSYIAEGPAISAHVDQFVAIKAKDGKGAEVETHIKEYQEKLMADGMQYPINQVKIKASDVVRHDDYVFFVMLGNPDPELEEQGEEAILESAKEQNQIAVDIINSSFN